MSVSAAQSRAEPPARRVPTAFLAGMRIRKKLIVLHTVFWLGLAGILLVLVRPAVVDLVRKAETSEARTMLSAMLRLAPPSGPALEAGMLPEVSSEDAQFRVGSALDLGLSDAMAREAMAKPGEIVTDAKAKPPRAVAYLPDAEGGGVFCSLSVRNAEARAAVVRLYGLLILALLAVYGLVAISLEVFVLPQHVYAPIRRMLEADRAVQEGRRSEELIAPSAIPADELGEIMRSRNESIVELRRHERDLARALAQLEDVATDLARKNHLLEATRRNLADADRLASLGMMSAGIAHELNTPLTVLKGLVERLHANPSAGVDAETAALMLRVVDRLERLGESLLDFARVRPPRSAMTAVRPVVEEAATLVRLDRGAGSLDVHNAVPDDVQVDCDGDRMVQVFVNLLRNAADAARLKSARTNNGAVRVDIRAEVMQREGARWVSITVADTGPGIDPEILPRLFEPFSSTRLDARGTGLGLAVAEGIVHEHGGLLLAKNRTDGPGAVFEVMLPMHGGPAEGA